MKDTLVIGSGITGLTTALLLAKRGRKVTLVEKLPHVGGLLHRFTRQGCRFDTGFHFTGGFDNILPQMLEYLNLQDDVRPAPITASILLAESSRRFEMPTTGLDDLEEALSSQFPEFAQAIHRYYTAEKEVMANTPIFDISKLDRVNVFSQFTNYDHLTTNEYMDEIGITSPELRTLLPIFALCHGTPPSESPFSYHCRCSFGMESHLTSVVSGGDAFISGFSRELEKNGASIRTCAWLERLICSETSPLCQTAILNTGEAFDVDEIYFTNAPGDYIGLFPEKAISPRLRKRIANLKPTVSFSTVYGIIDAPVPDAHSLTFYIANNDLDHILLPGNQSSTTGIVISHDPANQLPTLTAFRSMFVEDILEKIHLDPSIPYHRQPAYLDFKQQCQEAIIQEINGAHPNLKGKITYLESGTPLTCRTFSPPTGSAYGTRQILTFSRLSGKLPVENCYALGHHTYFPGILGSMLGAFIFAK